MRSMRRPRSMIDSRRSSRSTRGLVAVGYPPGTLTRPLDDAVDAAVAKGVQVVQASRGLLEPEVIARSGLTARGLIPNTDIAPTKAKILLQVCLAQGLSGLQIAEMFATY